MQRVALLTKAVMHVTQLFNKSEKIAYHISQVGPAESSFSVHVRGCRLARFHFWRLRLSDEKHSRRQQLRLPLSL